MNDSSESAVQPVARRVSLIQTVRAVLFAPRAWFSELPGGRLRAAWIVVLVHLIALPIAQLGMRFLEPVRTQKVLATFFTAPIIALGTTYFSALVVYLLARLPGQAQARFGTLVKCMAYAQVPVIAAVVPVVGPVVGLIWYIWLSALALRCALRCSWAFAWTGTLCGPGLLVGLGAFSSISTESFKMPSPSMSPTLLVGDHFFVSKTAFGWIDQRLPERGEIVAFRSPEHPHAEFAKRVIGLPGDQIVFRGTAIYINDWKVPTCVVGDTTLEWEHAKHQGEIVVEFVVERAYVVFHEHSTYFSESPDDVLGPYTVAAGEVLVVGDNRENSYDSRGWFGGRGGSLPKDNINGLATRIWLSSAPDSGMRYSRIGRSLGNLPRCDSAWSAETCAGLERCLANPPPRSATQPPASPPPPSKADAPIPE